jgi:hypothetical protein
MGHIVLHGFISFNSGGKIKKHFSGILSFLGVNSGFLPSGIIKPQLAGSQLQQYFP